MNIAELIALATVRSGKSRGELAAELGYKNQSKLSKLSAGENKPTATEIIYLAEKANLPPVMTLAEIEGEMNPEFKSLWEKIKTTASNIRNL